MNDNPLSCIENEKIEIQLLLEAIFVKYGYDFRDYSQAHIKRRIMSRYKQEGFKSISQMQHRIIYDQGFFQVLLNDLSINVTEMFRDPYFYKFIRREIIPILKTYPFIKIWHAGCSTGEEVYSMAILLKEEGLYERCQIFATDFNDRVLKKAIDGIYPLKYIREYTSNYQESGGHYSLADYYTAKYESVIMDTALKEKIVFANHNLVTDSVFGEINMIVCRNVLIYFTKPLQDQVIKLFSDSLCSGGILALGSKENLAFCECGADFETVAEKEKVFKKKYY